MYLFIGILVLAVGQWLTNKCLNISDENTTSYLYSTKSSIVILALFGVGIGLSFTKFTGTTFLFVCLGYGVIFLATMVMLGFIKNITITKQREELQKVFDVLAPVLPKNAELDMNNPPFKLGYEKTKVNRITIEINPNTFKENVAVNLCLSLNKFLPDYEWINEFDFASRECSFVGTPLPPHVAKYMGSWLRPTELIPIGLSGKGEVSWKLSSCKNDGRSLYMYEDGKKAKTVDIPSAPQALVVGGTGGGKAIYVEQEVDVEE